MLQVPSLVKHYVAKALMSLINAPKLLVVGLPTLAPASRCGPKFLLQSNYQQIVCTHAKFSV